MANEKMTNAKALEYVLSNCSVPSEVADKLNKMLEQTLKKSSGNRKPTATEIANEGYKELILAIANSTPMTCTDFQKSIPEFAEFSNQKVTALVKALVDANKLTKTISKGRSYFTLAK